MDSFKIEQKSLLNQANAKIHQLTNDLETMKSQIESIMYSPDKSGLVARNSQPVYFNFGLKSHIRSGTGIIKFDADRGSRLRFRKNCLAYIRFTEALRRRVEICRS